MTTTPRTNTELKDAIVHDMEWTPSINSGKVGVSVTGDVILEGVVHSRSELHHAGDGLRGANPVRRQSTVLRGSVRT